jgi:hypothetical protein
LARSAGHDDRALGIGRDVLAYRSEEHPGEPAVAARADHEQIGILGEVDEQFRCVALLDLRMYEDPPVLAADIPNRFHQQLFCHLPGIGRSMHGSRAKRPGERGWYRQPGRQQDKLRAVPNRLVTGPFERRPSGRRAVDATLRVLLA